MAGTLTGGALIEHRPLSQLALSPGDRARLSRAVTAANCFRIDHAKVYFIDWPRPCQVHLTPHQEGLHYLEDISAGKLLVLEHGRREGVDGGPDVVVEKEDVKTSVGVKYLKRKYQFAYFRCTVCKRALRTQDSMLQCRYTSKTA